MFILHFHLKKLTQSIEYQIHFAENEIKKRVGKKFVVSAQKTIKL
jgi:hypothetical protein